MRHAQQRTSALDALYLSVQLCYFCDSLLAEELVRPEPPQKRKRGRPPGTIKSPGKREYAMAELFRSGKTLEEIGNLHGLSRERVRQLLVKIGMNGNSGGRSVKTLVIQREREDIKKSEAIRVAMDVYGCTAEEVSQIQGNLPATKRGTPCLVYRESKNSALQRNIPWGFTLVTWWRVWCESGKWPFRGRGATAYCMSRSGDVGAYAPGNIKIITNSVNVKEGFLRIDGATRYKTSLHLRPKSRSQEMYDLYCSGMGPKAIAEKMGVKAGTVASQIHNVKRKLGVIRNDG